LVNKYSFVSNKNTAYNFMLYMINRGIKQRTSKKTLCECNYFAKTQLIK